MVEAGVKLLIIFTLLRWHKHKQQFLLCHQTWDRIISQRFTSVRLSKMRCSLADGDKIYLCVEEEVTDCKCAGLVTWRTHHKNEINFEQNPKLILCMGLATGQDCKHLERPERIKPCPHRAQNIVMIVFTLLWVIVDFTKSWSGVLTAVFGCLESDIIARYASAECKHT